MIIGEAYQMSISPKIMLELSWVDKLLEAVSLRIMGKIPITKKSLGNPLNS